MTIAYYHRNGVVVTNRYLTSGPYRYEIGELTDLRQALGPKDEQHDHEDDHEL